MAEIERTILHADSHGPDSGIIFSRRFVDRDRPERGQTYVLRSGKVLVPERLSPNADQLQRYLFESEAEEVKQAKLYFGSAKSGTYASLEKKGNGYIVTIAAPEKLTGEELHENDYFFRNQVARFEYDNDTGRLIFGIVSASRITDPSTLNIRLVEQGGIQRLDYILAGGTRAGGARGGAAARAYGLLRAEGGIQAESGREGTVTYGQPITVPGEDITYTIDNIEGRLYISVTNRKFAFRVAVPVVLPKEIDDFLNPDVSSSFASINGLVVYSKNPLNNIIE